MSNANPLILDTTHMRSFPRTVACVVCGTGVQPKRAFRVDTPERSNIGPYCKVECVLRDWPEMGPEGIDWDAVNAEVREATANG